MITEKEAIALLKKYSCSKKSFDIILRHSKLVQKQSLKIADDIIRNKHKVDKNFIKVACILHDIGRFECPIKSDKAVLHGIIGSKILRKEGLNKIALVAERHLGAGISKEDIKNQKLDLPLKDYIPATIEEKIITHADNLIFGDKVGTIKMVVERYRRELGEDVAKKMIKLNDEIEKLRGKS